MSLLICRVFHLLAVFCLASESVLAALPNSPENDLALSLWGDEAWLERRGGEWGKPSPPSRILYLTRGDDGRWNSPARFAPVMAGGDGGEPFYHAATETLYFTSSRALPGMPRSKANIWRMRRTSGGWGEPEPLPAPVNSPGAEYSPVIAGSHLYFASWRDGRGDLYRTSIAGDGWQVKALGPALNSPTGEWNLWVSDDETRLVFEASERPTNVSTPGDLYASAIDDLGRWLPAVPLTSLNGPGSELNPRVHGDTLVYASTSDSSTQADLYSAPATLIDQALLDAWDFRLLVVNRSSHSVSEVNLLAGRVVEEMPVGPGPHLVAVQGERFAVAAYGQFPRPHEEPVAAMPGWVQEEGGALLIGSRVPHPVRVSCRRPHGAIFDTDAQRLWVSCEDQQGVVELDLGGEPVPEKFIATNRDGAHVLAWDETRQQLLVSHTAAGGVAFVEPDAGAVEFLALAPGAEALFIDEERAEAWVTLGPSGALAILDLESRKEIQRLTPGCTFPIDFDLAAGGTLWVACFGSQEIVGMSLETREVVDRLALPAGPLNIAAHPLLPVIYASLPRRNRVVEISTVGRGITREFETGMEPDGLAVVKSR